MQALLYISHEHLITLVIPAPCLADALARLRDPEQQARLFDLLKSPMAKVEEFGTAEATGTGLLRSNALPARASTGAAHAAFLAADRGWPVVSARPGPIRAMHPEVEIEPLPDADVRLPGRQACGPAPASGCRAMISLMSSYVTRRERTPPAVRARPA